MATLLETLRALGLTSPDLTPDDTRPLRVVRTKPARRPGLDRWAWQVGDTIVYTNAGEKPKVTK